MRHIGIFSIGKSREPWLKSALDEYEKRLTCEMKISWHLFSKDQELEKALLAEKGGFIALDPQGKQVTSEEFTELILPYSHTSFAIGGPEGLTSQLRQKAKFLLGLSKLTFTHQATRLILLEQLYRAIQIDKGSDYHK